MTSLIFREMKGTKFSCASPASAAICTSIDRQPIIPSSANRRSIDRHHATHLRDSRRPSTLNPFTQFSSKPKSYHLKNRRSSEKSKPADQLITPATSTRQLLTDSAFSDAFPDSELVSAMPTYIDGQPRFRAAKRDELANLSSPSLSSSSSSSSCFPSSSEDQVVVLRVSLHCKGCEGESQETYFQDGRGDILQH